MSKDEAMSEETMWYEWGFRLPDGRVEWQIDHGTDGTWTAFVPELGLGAIDMYDGQQYAAIRQALDEAGLTDAAVLRQRVVTTRGPVEEVTGQ